MRELNMCEIEEVNGGSPLIWFFRFMRPTMMGNGELPPGFGNIGGNGSAYGGWAPYLP